MSHSGRGSVVGLVGARGQTGSWNRCVRVFTKIALIVEERLGYKREYSE